MNDYIYRNYDRGSSRPEAIAEALRHSGLAILMTGLTTAGGLVFMGASMDKKMRALDVRTGEELWQAELPYAGMAVPMSYMADGKQYVVMAAGGNRRTVIEEGNAVVAFALPDEN